jgi:Winged helix-turn-helix DNA-binding
MPDLLDSIRGQLRARLDELRPLVREYKRLQDAERALGDGPAPSPTRAGRSRRTEAGRGGGARADSRRRTSSAANREANRQKILGLVRERPGITRAELKDAAGLSGAGVAQNLRRMLNRGEVREEALPGGTTGYRIADGQSDPTANSGEGETQQ